MNDYFKKYIFVHWGKWVLISLGVLISILVLLVPLVFIFVTVFSEGWLVVRKNLSNYDMIHAIFLTVLISLLSIPLNLFFGVLLSWLVTRFRFRGRQLLLMLVNIPVAISPVVVGLLYLLLYGNHTFIGNFLNKHGIQILFSIPGMVLVIIFITFPIIVHELVPVMLIYGKEEDEIAVLLGASGWKMFYYVTLQNIRWALLYGMVLANARAIGEFGALSIVSGLIRGETYTLSLQVELLYQDYNMVGAFVASLFLIFITIFTLFIKGIVQYCLKEGYVK